MVIRGACWAVQGVFALWAGAVLILFGSNAGPGLVVLAGLWMILGFPCLLVLLLTGPARNPKR